MPRQVELPHLFGALTLVGERGKRAMWSWIEEQAMAEEPGILLAFRDRIDDHSPAEVADHDHAPPVGNGLPTLTPRHIVIPFHFGGPSFG